MGTPGASPAGGGGPRGGGGGCGLAHGACASVAVFKLDSPTPYTVACGNVASRLQAGAVPPYGACGTTSKNQVPGPVAPPTDVVFTDGPVTTEAWDGREWPARQDPATGLPRI